MTIIHITSNSQLDGILTKSNNKLTVIDFHAAWCRPCHAIAPVFEALSKKHTNVDFLKCDVDAAQEVAQRYSVAAMPTFIFLKGASKVDQVKGANRSALEETINKHSASSTAAFSGRGQTLGGGSAPVDVKFEVSSRIMSASNGVSGLDPQVKILLALVIAYAFFWYLS